MGEISNMLSDSLAVLTLSDCNLRDDALIPLFKAIYKQHNLHTLNLSGNILTTEGMELLCNSLVTLTNLNSLNLSSNNLKHDSIRCLADVFIQHDDVNVPVHIQYLDLSFNPLTDIVLQSLAIITRHLQLNTLKLRDVNFTNHIFDCEGNESIELYLELLEVLDIGYNYMDKDQIARFVSWLKPTLIQHIDVSNNELCKDGLTKELIQLLEMDENLKLKELVLCRCRVSDMELYELLR